MSEPVHFNPRELIGLADYDSEISKLERSLNRPFCFFQKNKMRTFDKLRISQNHSYEKRELFISFLENTLNYEANSTEFIPGTHSNINPISGAKLHVHGSDTINAVVTDNKKYTPGGYHSRNVTIPIQCGLDKLNLVCNSMKDTDIQIGTRLCIIYEFKSKIEFPKAPNTSSPLEGVAYNFENRKYLVQDGKLRFRHCDKFVPDPLFAVADSLTNPYTKRMPSVLALQVSIFDYQQGDIIFEGTASVQGSPFPFYIRDGKQKTSKSANKT